MDASRDRLPRGSVLVCAAVLTVGPSVAAHAGEPAVAAEEPAAGDGTTDASTDDGATADSASVEDAYPVAPTCGPCCHGSYGPECEGPLGPPPPIDPATSKKGCAVHPSAPETSGSLALLALMLAVARRREP